MSDYFDRVEHELRAAASRRATAENRRRTVRPTASIAVAALSIVTTLLIAGLALSLHHHPNQPESPPAPHQRDLSAEWHVGPTLHELMANFSVLRRPVSAADRAAIGRFTAPSAGRPEAPEYVRLAGVVDGVRVYFVVYPIFRHGASGPVVAHQMHVIASSGNGYAPGNYLIFPTLIVRPGGPSAYLGVVPDGVQSVSWRFTCPPPTSGCQLPAERVAHVPVHDNLAVLPLAALLPGRHFASPSRVTWYRIDGSKTIFTDPNTAVPFPGAPAWPGSRVRRPHRS